MTTDHDRLVSLEELSRHTTENLDQVVDKFNEFIRDRQLDMQAMVGVGKDNETMKTDLREIKVAIHTDLAPRADVDAVRAALKTDYALRSEFMEIKTEWRGTLKVVLVFVLAALLGLLGWTSVAAPRIMK
jgi:hypothetical protein